MPLCWLPTCKLGSAPLLHDTSWRLTHGATALESAFQFIGWESSISLTRKLFCMCVGFFSFSFFFFFKHNDILDLTLCSPISVSNNHYNIEGKHYLKGLNSPTSSLAAFKIRCYYDFPPGKHLRIFFASNHNYNISPCSSSPPLGWRIGAQRSSFLPQSFISYDNFLPTPGSQTEAEKDVSRSSARVVFPPLCS